MAQHHHYGTAAGTAGGMLLSLFASIHADDILKTAVLALTGATVSFTASMIMRWIARKMTGK